MKFSVITSTYNQLEQLKKVREWLNKQTFIDFEWIVADDGSSDGTDKWAKKNADKYVRHDDMGYRLTKILNKACFEASGEFLVWIMGDSYPDSTFLEHINEHITENRLLTGVRINVNDEGLAVSRDWRARSLPVTEGLIVIKAKYPWGVMTLNSMVMSKKKFDEMGGIYSGYDEGYGRMDWDMAAWAHYHGMELGVVANAIIYHQIHEEKEDTQHNIELFEKRVKEMQDAL